MAQERKRTINGRPVSGARETATRAGLTFAVVHRRAKEGTFPEPVLVGSRTALWFDDEVDAWIAETLATHKPWAGLPQKAAA